MDIPAASAGPWIVLGAVLGLLLVALAGVVVALLRRGGTTSGTTTGTTPPPRPGADGAADDLPGFLEHPPGTRARDRRGEGWVALAPPAAPAAPTSAQPGAPRSGTVRVLAAMGLVALLLLGAAAAVAVTGRDRGTSASGTSSTGVPSDAPAGGGGGAPSSAGEARLTFGGVVLERRAVGVTATYPTVVLEGSGAAARATVELPTFNCLTAEAPPDPSAAGCVPTGTEFAELTAPALQVSRHGRELRASGRFATWRHPNGSPPTRTGRAYDLVVTAAPVGDDADEGWLPARGTLQLGADRADAVEGGAQIRYPD